MTDHAIVIGIRRYPTLGGAGTPMDLAAPDDDAKAVADWIGGLQDGRPKHVELIRTAKYDPFDPEDPKPIANDIVKAFTAIANQPRGSDDRVGQRFYLYVSGHGFGFRRHLGALFTANASDMDRDHVYIPDYFEWLIEAGLFKEYVLWFDACSTRDRVTFPKFASLKPIKARQSPEGREMVAYAARFFMSAVENTIDGQPRGVFTHTLLEGLRGAAADPATGAVTTASLRNYLINNMRRHMSPEQLADPSVSKEPDFGTVDDFVLVPAAVVAHPTAPAAPAPAGPRFRLSVASDDPATELFVVDAGDALVARGLKDLSVGLPAADYTIRARLGRSEWQETIRLDADRDVALPAISFASAAPLPGTDRTHETHVAAARMAGEAVEKGPGEGAALMVMARWWTGRGAPPYRPLPEPQAGLALHHHGEAVPFDLGARATEGDLDGDRWATRSVTVDPGLHRLALTTDGEAAEMTVTALEGWRTGAFLLFEPGPDPALRGKRLADVAVLMWKGDLLEDGPSLRLAEAARVALADERSVMSPELLETAGAKSGNPMMGLYALHLMLLLREKEQEEGRPHPEGAARPAPRGPARPAQFDPGLFQETLANSVALFGEDHPDIRAVRFAFGQEAGRLPVAAPPMLWRSWSALVEASNDNPRLLPVDLWERVAEQVPQRPYMIWLRRSEALRGDGRLRQVEENLGRIARTVVGVPAGRAAAPFPGTPGPGPAAGLSQPAPSPLADADSRRRLSVDMGVPRSVIDRALRGR